MLALQAGLAVAILLLGGIGLLFPSAVPGVPQAGSAPALVLLAFGVAFYALLALRAVRTYTLTRRTTDLLVFVGCFWLGWALVPQLVMGYGTLAFYFGHGMELLGIVLVGIPAALDLRQGGASRPLVGDLTADRARRRRGGLPRPARARADDRPRREGPLDRGAHPPRRDARLRGRRGAQAAARHAAPPRDRRAAARHGQAARARRRSSASPPRSTPEEFEAIKRHPQDGARLLADLGGFAPEVLDLVLDHHERLDGGGYPRGLKGDCLGPATRVLTVCDVYDALVSDRVYRPAWSRERALGLLREESGAAFDPGCVAALERVLARTAGRPGLGRDASRPPPRRRVPASRR